jgi:hypothetical protein
VKRANLVVKLDGKPTVVACDAIGAGAVGFRRLRTTPDELGTIASAIGTPAHFQTRGECS